MPFQSEKQRKYLWANEPAIARDWTDTYGSGIAKALGGRIPFYAGSGVAMNIYNKPLNNQFSEQLTLPFDFSNTGDPYKDNLYVDLSKGQMKALDNPTTKFNIQEMGDYSILNDAGFRAQDIEGKPPTKQNIIDYYKGTYKPTASLNNLVDNRYVDSGMIGTDATYVDDNRGINTIPFNQQYLEGSGWLNDARTADELSQLPIDALPNKRQKLTDFLSRFIPGATVAKMLRPDANEAYGNVAGLYPEEVFGMQEFGSGEDLRTDPWGKNIVSFAGDYEQGKKDWWEKNKFRKYRTKRMKQKKEWHRQAVEKIRQEEAAREQRKRAQVQAMSHQNRIQNTGGWQSGMAKDPGFMSGKGTSAEMGSFNRGGLAGLWQR